MPILGIDGNKCVQCEECVHDCPKFLFSRGNSGLVEFADPYNSCLQCGHCVAVCPTDAILRRNMEDVESFPGIETPEHLVNYVNFFHLLQAKRSIRRYKKDIVPQTVLDQIFAAIRYAPAGSNSRTITYTLISDPSKIHTLSEMASELFVLKGIFGPVYGQHVQQKINRGLDPIFCGAPHVLIADSQDEMGFDIVNATVALTYGMLAAETLGVEHAGLGCSRGQRG